MTRLPRRHRRPRPSPAVVDESAPVMSSHRPTWWTVATVRWIAFAAVWVALALGLLAVFVVYRQAETAQAVAAATNHRLTVLEQYVDGKGDQRDRENAALHQQMTQAICDLLDQLPAGGLLDKPRAKYGCGPGLPPVAQPGANRPAPSPPTATTAAAPTTTPAAPPAPAGPAPGSPAPPSAPAPSSAPPGLLCTVLRPLCPTP